MSSIPNADRPGAPDEQFLVLKKNGRTLLYEGRLAEAEGVFHEALALEAGAPDILFLLGQIAQSRAHYQAAIDYYKRSLQGAVLFETYKALAGALIGARDIQGALKALEEGTKIFGWDYDTVVSAGVAYIYSGNHEKALEFLLKALRREPGRLPAKVYLSHLLQIGYMPPYSEELKSALLECLKETHIDHSYFAPAWAQQIKDNPEAQGLRDLLQARDYAAFSALFSQPKNRRFLQEPFFLYGLKRLSLHKPSFEMLLARMRRYYLETIYEGDFLAAGDLDLLCAIAANCYLSEYLPPVTEGEKPLLANIRGKLESGSALPDEVAVFAAYESLANIQTTPPLNKNSALLRSAARDLIRAQIAEPAEEKKIKEKLERLVPIDDAISKAVQDMYEENPYPRWLCTGVHTSLDPVFARGRGKKILIAGCGTGKQAVHVAAAWPEAEVLAIDLSSSSLAYAARKVREYGYDNVTFRQADILKLGDVLEPESFDRVESTGVLHHMKEPMAGWRVLTELLKPGGEMTIGLYARLSRVQVDRARQLVKDLGYKPTREGIQKFRQHLMSLPAEDPLYVLTGWQDFYSLSNCRDLLFHVQERNYSLAEIKECLEALGLEFAGFKKWPHAFLKHYKERYPDDVKMTNILNWHALEMDHPDMFALHNIYLFYVRKPD